MLTKRSVSKCILYLHSKFKVMQKRIIEIFILVILSLIGIVAFQVYWCVNAYKVNKKNFDANVDLAMQRAMDDCKKDYFDSIRVILVRRLSDPGMKITIDTLHEADTVHKQLIIYFSMADTAKLRGDNSPFNTTNLIYNYYAKMIGPHPTVPQVLTEMSFYVPQLMGYFTGMFGMKDIQAYPRQFAKFNAYNSTHIFVPEDMMLKLDSGMDNSIYGFPPNFRHADSLKLNKHLANEMDKKAMHAPFSLHLSIKPTTPAKPNIHFSETNEYSYKYHGFKVFGIIGPEFLVKATFRSPYHVIFRSMWLVFLLSLILIITSIYGFNYLIKIVQKQRKLAELKDDFINNMTHELKTPIAILTVAIEGLQKFNALDDAEKTQRYLQTSRSELVRLNDLVTKVLNISAFEHDKINLVKENTNADELIKDVIASELLKTDKKVEIYYQNNGLTTIAADKLHF